MKNLKSKYYQIPNKSKIPNSKLHIKNFAFWLIILIFGFCILNFMGCALPQRGGARPASQMLEAQAISKFSDIPVPVGFKLVPNDSYSFESSGVRVGVLKFQGKGNPDLVVGFFKEQMIMYNWNMVNIIEYGQRILNFERQQESCIINLVSKGNNITFIISVGPKSTLPKRTDKPIK